MAEDRPFIIHIWSHAVNFNLVDSIHRVLAIKRWRGRSREIKFQHPSLSPSKFEMSEIDIASAQASG